MVIPTFQTGAPSKTQNRRRSEMTKLCLKHNIPLIDTECSVCHGSGEVEPECFGDYYEQCWNCSGTGVGFPDCEECQIEREEDAAEKDYKNDAL